MYVYFQELFDLSSKQTSRIDILFGEITSLGDDVCVCVCVRAVSYTHLTLPTICSV